MNVGQFLKPTKTRAATVLPGARIRQVITALAAEDVGALVVSNNGSQIDGIISERDVVRGLHKYGPTVLDHKVSDLMSKDVITCTAQDRVSEIMAIMNTANIRHVPLVDGGCLVGIVSIRDILALRLNEVEADAAAMRHRFGIGVAR